MSVLALLSFALLAIVGAVVVSSRSRTDEFLSALFAFDEQLVAANFPPMSPWWRETITRFLRSGRKRLVLRVGRRGGKSSTLARLAVAWAVYGDWSVPPGDIGVVAFLSVDRDEAAARLRLIASILDARGIRYSRRGDEIELRDRPCVFRVVTASARNAVGFTSLMVIADEVPRWRDADSGANPAREVIASVAPTMATQPGARLILCGSPWSHADYHAEQFNKGDDEHQIAAHAATWTANPTLSEEATRELEGDPRAWSREYGALPVDAITAIASPEEIAECTSKGTAKRPVPDERRCAYFFDAGLRNDRTALLRVWREPRELPSGRIVEMHVISVVSHLVPSFVRRVTLDDIVREIVAAHRECKGVFHGDNHYFDGIAGPVRELGIPIVELPNTSSAISARVASLQARITQQSIDLPDHPELQREIRDGQLVSHPGGRMTFRAPERRGAHDDLVSALLLSLDADVQRVIPLIDGDLVVRYDPVHWEAETSTLHGGGVRYMRRAKNGKLYPREPPYGSPEFEAWARDMNERGLTTPSIERFAQEREEDGDPWHVPIIGG